MTEKQKKSIDHLTKLDSYFARHSIENILWAREYDVVNKISNLITKDTGLAKSDFDKIVEIFNKIEEAEHFDGSGWHDYRIRLSGLFYCFGYNLKWNSSSKLIIGFDFIK